MPRPLGGRFHVSGGLLLFGQAPGRQGRQAPQPLPLDVEPLLELGRVGDEEPFQQVAAVRLESLAGSPRLRVFHEGSGIAPDRLRSKGELLISGRNEDGRPNGATKDVEGLIQSVTGPRLVQIRPEQAQQRVAPVRVALSAGGQIRKQRDALGLGQDRLQLASIGRLKVQGAQRVEAYHLVIL